MRVPAEDIKQVATVIDGREYRAHNGFFDMPSADASVHLRSGDYGSSWNAAGVAKSGAGYRCTDCGFGSFFIRCSRCGGSCQKGNNS